ncbi:MAG TPA: transcription antitermination factor NusB [Clostridiales bacterium]|jgi:N utilization substance protein B|nr:transcription antitermination factor NusB [Clostridiales bacterium]
MARRPAREAAMRLLYQEIFTQDFGNCDLGTFRDITSDLVLDKRDIPYMEDILRGCTDHQEEIDRIIRTHSKAWKFERIAKVDLSILRLALYEINYRDDIPDSVSVNEAVELGKKYGGDQSGSFINGILGAYLRQCTPSGSPSS